MKSRIMDCVINNVQFVRQLIYLKAYTLLINNTHGKSGINSNCSSKRKGENLSQCFLSPLLSLLGLGFTPSMSFAYVYSNLEWSHLCTRE